MAAKFSKSNDFFGRQPEIGWYPRKDSGYLGADTNLSGSSKSGVDQGWLSKDGYSSLAMGLSLLGGISQASALEAQGNYQDTIAKINAGFAERNAADAIKRGEKEANQHKQKVGEIVSEQRAGFAAQNIDVGSGSAADVQLGTDLQGIEDAKTIRNNAIREALGYKMQAFDSRNQGSIAKISARGAANSTLLTGGIQALSMYRGKGS